MGKYKPINKHHLIQKAEREFYNIHDPRNIKRMYIVQHNALHALFHNLTTPKDQLEKLRELFDPILSDQAREIYDILLQLPIKEFYDD